MILDILGANGVTATFGITGRFAESNPGVVARIVARCLERAEPGAIYLFHVGRQSDDAAALQRVIDGLRAAGYGFDTAAHLVG